MYRIAIEKLLKWKQSKRRKPLIIEGAIQMPYISILTLIPEWQSYLLLTWILTA